MQLSDGIIFHIASFVLPHYLAKLETRKLHLLNERCVLLCLLLVNMYAENYFKN